MPTYKSILSTLFCAIPRPFTICNLGTSREGGLSSCRSHKPLGTFKNDNINANWTEKYFTILE